MGQQALGDEVDQDAAGLQGGTGVAQELVFEAAVGGVVVVGGIEVQEVEAAGGVVHELQRAVEEAAEVGVARWAVGQVGQEGGDAFGGGLGALLVEFVAEGAEV